MSNDIILLTKESRDVFRPCIMDDIWQYMEGNDIFGHGIAKDNNAIGAIVCSYVDGIVNLLSLGVSPEYHRQGVARQLLTHLEQVCSANGFSEIQGRFFMGEQERAPLEALLTSCGYSMIDGEFEQVVFALGGLAGSRVEKQLQKTNSAQTMKKLVTLGALSIEQQQWLLEAVSVEWEDMSRLSMTRSCANLRDGQIVGAVLIAEQQDTLEIVQIYSAPDNEAASMLCLFATMGEAFATLPADTTVRFHAINELADSVITKLLDNCEIKTIVERIAYRSVAVPGNDAVQD